MARPRRAPVEAPEENSQEQSAPVEAPEEGLILVAKDGEELEIHPDAEADHARLGWFRV